MGKSTSDRLRDAPLDPQLYAKLESLYLNPNLPSGFSSAAALYKAARSIQGVTRSVVRRFLHEQPTYVRLSARRRRFPRRPFVSFSLHSFWQADLLEVGNLSRQNSNVKFILIVVEQLGGFVWLRPLKSKSGSDVSEAMESIFDSSGLHPRFLLTDRGREFYCKEMFSMLGRHHVILISTQNYDIKASLAERMARTLRGRIFRYLDANRTLRYIDELQSFAVSINATVNRSTGLAPKDVTSENEGRVFSSRYGEGNRMIGRKKAKSIKPYPFKFSSGDVVRVALPFELFGKGSDVQFSNALHRVEDSRSTLPHTYRISVLDSTGQPIGEPLEKGYYSPELSLQLNPLFHSPAAKAVPRRRRQI